MYIPSNWKSGDIITADKLNNIETGIQEVVVGSQSQVQYFGTGKINFDFGNKLIVIPNETNIVVGKKIIKIGSDITTAIPTDNIKFFILTVSLQRTTFECYTSSTINTMSKSEVVIAVCNKAQQTVEMNGDYLINGQARIADNSVLPDGGKIPINRYKTFVGQDATKVGNEYWLFDGSTPDHMSTTSIHRINPTDFSEIGLITHNLGHANGVDYRNNTLLVYNGSALPPEINLYKNPDNTMTNLKIQDAANTQIIFKESNKLLPGDGSACFGLDNKIVYYAYCAGTQVIILKILLGLGDNDLSDKTTDKSDNQHWGNFVSGKSSDDYNGTAQIITSYTGEISGDNQPQGMAFNGDLYLGTSHAEQKAYQLQLLDDGSYKIVNDYESEMTDYKNNVIGLEPEITFIDPVKRSIFVGGRGSLSNVAEFNL